MSDLKMFFTMFRMVLFKFTAICLTVSGIGTIFSKEIDFSVIGLLCVVVGYFLFNIKVVD